MNGQIEPSETRELLAEIEERVTTPEKALAVKRRLAEILEELHELKLQNQKAPPLSPV